MIMLILGITLLVGGGVASALTKQLKLDHKQASKVLEHAPVREPALDALERLRQISVASLKESQELFSDAAKPGRDHDRPSSELVPIIEPHVAEIANLDRAFLDKRDELHGMLTRDQWNAVFRPDSSAADSS